jgi:hypothetical protein
MKFGCDVRTDIFDEVPTTLTRASWPDGVVAWPKRTRFVVHLIQYKILYHKLFGFHSAEDVLLIPLLKRTHACLTASEEWFP